MKQDKILMGAERKSAYIPEKEKLDTAYHEAGHAIVALYTEGAMPLHKVTCVPRGHALGIVSRIFALISFSSCVL
jgi:ATP-dependent metalloprotease